MTVHKLKKFILFLVLFTGVGSTCLAEGNLPFVDQKLIHFGFLLGINAMDFKVNPNDNARVSMEEPGFTVGIISDLRLSRYLNLRFIPTLHFGERALNYPFKVKIETDSISSLNISSIPICLPLFLKYSAERKGNYRPYLIGGVGLSYDLATNANADNPVTLKPFNVYTEFGVGCDIYFSFFKLSPEIKYSLGFNNILVPVIDRPGLTGDKRNFTSTLSQLTSRILTLTFNFE